MPRCSASSKILKYMIYVYTKIDDKLACWEVDASDPGEAIAIVREELPRDWTIPVLARVK